MISPRRRSAFAAARRGHGPFSFCNRICLNLSYSTVYSIGKDDWTVGWVDGYHIVMRLRVLHELCQINLFQFISIQFNSIQQLGYVVSDIINHT